MTKADIAVDPADLWDEYCKETPVTAQRTPQGAIAFAVDRLAALRSPVSGERDGPTSNEIWNAAESLRSLGEWQAAAADVLYAAILSLRPASNTTTTEFKNELGNTIRITIEGPTSKSTNDLTPNETAKLTEALTNHFERIRPATGGKKAMDSLLEIQKLLVGAYNGGAWKSKINLALHRVKHAIAALQSPPQCEGRSEDAPQLDRVFIGKGEYVRADTVVKQIEDLQRNLRHWREECGKLHAKLAASVSPTEGRETEARLMTSKDACDLGFHCFTSPETVESRCIYCNAKVA